MLYSSTHMATVGVKGLMSLLMAMTIIRLRLIVAVVPAIGTADIIQLMQTTMHSWRVATIRFDLILIFSCSYLRHTVLIFTCN